MATTTNLIKEKKARLEILEELFSALEREEAWRKQKTVWYDTSEPYLDEDGNPQTRKDGTIKYKQDYRMEDIPESEYSEDTKAYLMAIQTIKGQLEKMI